MGAICGRLFSDRTGAKTWAVTHGGRRHCPMLCTAAGQRRASVECGYVKLATERFLDVAGVELHSVDGRAIRLDILRRLFT